MTPSALTKLTEFLTAQADSRQWPTLVASRLADDSLSVELDIAVNSTLEYFDGHFPNQPVLPGVVQIHWAGEFAQRLFALSGFTGLQGTKFNAMVLPDTTVTIKLQFKAEKSSVRFEYVSGQTKFSAGSIAFSATSQAA